MKQITIEQWMNCKEYEMMCKGCICRSCLYWWSGRCPYGGCYDDRRAKLFPYDVMHPGKIRDSWSDWKTQQAYWCRGGILYHALMCDHYVKYTGSRVEHCFGALVEKYQDGYMDCCLLEQVGCEKCYEDWRKHNEQIHKAG